MKKESKKRIDMYDIGKGLTLMNVIEKNESGKMHQITTYIGIEGNGFVCVGNANDLDAKNKLKRYWLLKITYKNTLISIEYSI